MSDSFFSPDNALSPACYWFWHHIPSREVIETQITQMDQAGFKTFQIQGRIALAINEYLSSEYLQACGYAATIAARRGMSMGIYDEYNWLSGHAGGRTVAGHDELRERHLMWVDQPLTAGTPSHAEINGIHAMDAEDLGPAGMEWIFEGGQPRWTDWRVVRALAYRPSEEPGGSIDLDQTQDVTDQVRIVAADEFGAKLSLPPAADTDWSVAVFVAARQTTSRMINYLLPEAAQRFIKVGIEPYIEAFGPHFGTTVDHLFFDQPHACFYRWEQLSGNVEASLLFDESLIAAVEAQTNTPLGQVLLALLHNVGDSTAALRCDFFESYSRLAMESYFGTLHAWAQDHGVALSGHEVLGHVGSWDVTDKMIVADNRVSWGTDYFGLDKYRDITGVDASNYEDQLPAKMGDSVARANGRRGCIIEQYTGSEVDGTHFGIGNWGVTLAMLRKQMIRHHILGASRFMFHAFYVGDGDDRPEEFVNPRFDFPPGINFEPWFEYASDMTGESGRLSTFLQGGEPITQVAVLYPLHTSWAHGPEHPYGRHSAAMTRRLAHLGVGFDLIDENLLVSATVAEGTLTLTDGRSYRTLVLPAVETVHGLECADIIEHAVQAGVSVIASGPLLRSSQLAGSHPRRGAELQQLLASTPGSTWSEEPVTDGLFQELLATTTPKAHCEIHYPATGLVDLEQMPRPVAWRWLGTEPDGSLRIAVFNDSAQPAQAIVHTGFAGFGVQQWNQSDGTVQNAGTTDSDGRFTTTLQAWQLACLRIPVAELVQLSITDGWSLRTGEGEPRPVAVTSGWEGQGWPNFSGRGHYTVSLRYAGVENRPARLTFPGTEDALAATVNGVVLGHSPWAPHEFDIPPGLLKFGENQLEVVVTSTAANRYYAHQPWPVQPTPSGILRPPILVTEGPQQC